MPILTNDAAKDIVHKREDTLIQGDHSSKAYRYRFEGGAKRHISIARPSRAGGATIYVNRQSTALDWFLSRIRSAIFLAYLSVFAI